MEETAGKGHGGEVARLLQRKETSHLSASQGLLGLEGTLKISWSNPNPVLKFSL